MYCTSRTHLFTPNPITRTQRNKSTAKLGQTTIECSSFSHKLFAESEPAGDTILRLGGLALHSLVEILNRLMQLLPGFFPNLVKLLAPFCGQLLGGLFGLGELVASIINLSASTCQLDVGNVSMSVEHTSRSMVAPALRASSSPFLVASCSLPGISPFIFLVNLAASSFTPKHQ